MNIITVGSYCAGGIVADLLNGVRSPFETSVIKSRWNHILKAKADDALIPVHLVLPEYTAEWIEKTERLVQKEWTKGLYFGTHQPPHIIPNLDSFEHVINITTNTNKSRFYRFLRHYYVEINGQKIMKPEAMSDIEGMIYICKFDPSWSDYDAPNVTNIEFEDIAEGRFCDSINGDQEHMAIWKRKNSYLFQEQDPNLIKFWEEMKKTDMQLTDVVAGKELDFYFKYPKQQQDDQNT